MSVAFSTDSSQVIEREVIVKHSRSLTSDEDLSNIYEVKRCADWITVNKYNQVALQFPDEILCHSASIAVELQQLTSATVFILADTSYGSCCVDEVAAEHYNADCIIHYGHACLSLTRRLPILYIFGRHTLDVDHCCKSLLHLSDSPLLVIYDVTFHRYRNELCDALSEHFPTLSIADVILPHNEMDSQVDNNSNSESNQLSDSDTNCDSTVVEVFGRRIKLAAGTTLSDYTACYIGSEGMALTNWIVQLSVKKFYTYCSLADKLREESFNVNRFMMKRYYLIEKAKDATLVGIVVGTLGVADYLTVVDRIRYLCKRVGKKVYTFAVGKPNVAKLANFPEVDIYVLVSCPENSLLDSKDFYKPIITPFELEVACNAARDWTGRLVTDFRQLLPGGSEYVEVNKDASQEFEGDVSLLTGSVLGVPFSFVHLSSKKCCSSLENQHF